MTAQDILNVSVSTLLGMLVFRLLPLVAYALALRGLGLGAKLIVLGALGTLLSSRHWLDAGANADIAYAAVALVYFVAATTAVRTLAGCVRAGRLSLGGAFTACAFVYLAVPSVVFPVAFLAVTLIPAWQVMLSAYSLCAEAKRLPALPSARDSIFFLVVNPTVVYPERGKRFGEPAWRVDAAKRMALGVFALASYVVAWSALGRFAIGPDASGTQLSAPAPLLMLCAFIVTYFAHSGVASLQIGALRMLGYQVPERYVYPLLASSPLDLWQRWNTYVGAWLRRYVFYPSSLWIGRRKRAFRGQIGLGAAALLTFLVAGLLHDIVDYLFTYDAPFRWTGFFAIHALALIAWALVGSSSAARNVAQRWPLMSNLVQRALLASVVSVSVFTTF